MGAIVMVQNGVRQDGGAQAGLLVATSDLPHLGGTIAEAAPSESGGHCTRAELSEDLARELLEQALEWEQVAERVRASLDSERRRRRSAWTRR